MPNQLLPAPDEKLLFFHLEGDDAERYGVIGYLRADFGKSGREFWSTWFDMQPNLLTCSFICSGYERTIPLQSGKMICEEAC